MTFYPFSLQATRKEKQTFRYINYPVIDEKYWYGSQLYKKGDIEGGEEFATVFQ